MPKYVEFIGTQQRWPELAITGKQSVWMPGQAEERSDAEAAQLLATGLFKSPDDTLTAADIAANKSLVTDAGNGAKLATLAATLPNSLPPELQPVDWWPDRLVNGDDTWLYGHSSANALDFVRIRRSDRNRTVVANPFSDSAPRGIRTIWVSRTTPGLLLCAVGQASQTAASMVIWRSADFGNSWASVLTLGSGVGGTINGVWMLSDRNVCEVDGVLYLGEYNVNSGRTDGGANDLVTLWRSVDRGATWAPALKWNEGTHVLRHIHALKPAPDNRILICVGDTDAESAMILWDRSTNISNTAHSGLAALGVPAQYGSQRCRAVDVDFRDGYIWWMSDGNTSATDTVSDMGWLRMPADLSAPPRRLDGKISAIPSRAIYYVASFSTGAQCFIEEITEAAGATTGYYGLGIWTTNETRTRIERTGVQRILSSHAADLPPTMFQVGDTAFVAFGVSGLGKGSQIGTVAFTVSATRRWCGVRPDTIHPVYWVDPVNGTDNTDTNRGYYPGLPWKTLKYALESNRVSQGGRVMLPAGDFEEAITASIALNADLTGADTTAFMTFEGAGIDSTKHSAAAASTQAHTFTLGSDANGGYEFKDLHLSTKRAVSTQGIFTGGGATNAQRMQFIRARVGGKDIGLLMNVCINTNIAAGGSITTMAWDSQFVATTVGGAYLIPGDTDGPHNFTGYRCVFDGGRGAFNPAGTDTIYCEDTLFTNFTVTAIRAAATATKVPTLVRARFHSLAGLPQWIDDASLTEAGQWTGARSTSPLSPAAIFDSTSRQDITAAPRDPKAFDYAAAI